MAKQNSPLVLGTEPIGKLLTQYAIPAIIAMTASSLYNMADSIFIGHGVGALAISGLALTFPLMNLAAAFGSLVGVGASTLVAVKLGQKDYELSRSLSCSCLIPCCTFSALVRTRSHMPVTICGLFCMAMWLRICIWD